VTAGSNDSVAVAPNGKSIIFARNSIRFPAELFVHELSNGERFCGWDCLTQFRGHGEDSKRLTHMNDAVLSPTITSDLERFYFEGAFGDQVESYLIKPPNFDPSKKYPTATGAALRLKT
jgi:dipeptidyl aminopeptidase/acylaminoacyl peptidase